ncbi:MAG: hypothetical protein KF779_14595 [Hyphomonadaceae bacterium]|nr:hypothetical protein [Hyphomonadaceae bacterium]
MTFRSPRTLIEQIDAVRFGALMRRLGVDGPFPERGAKHYAGAAMLLVLSLKDGQRDDFDEILDRVSGLGDDRGRNAILLAAGAHREEFEVAVTQHLGPVDSALWCLLEHSDVFQRAEAIFSRESARERAHDWIGSFQTDPAPEFRLTVLPLEVVASAFLAAYRARGDRCESLDLFPEERIEREGLDTRRIEIQIQRRGRPETAHVYEGASPIFKRLVPVMPDALIFHPQTGLVEIISRHGDVHRERLAAAFCDAALGREPPVKVERVCISFEPLRQPRKFNPSPGDNVRDVRLFELRFRNGKDGYEVIRADAHEDVYECMRRRETLHLLAGDIDRAAFEVWFGDGKSNSKGKPLKLALAGEDAISFPKWSPSRQAIGRKLLTEWGLIAE